MDVLVAAVLQRDVVVLQGDHLHRTDGEGVPEVLQLGVGLGRRQVEVRLVRAEADRPVLLLDLVVAGGRHPRPVARRAGVVGEEVVPGADPVDVEVGVAEVAVEQVEQRGDGLDAVDDVLRGRRRVGVERGLAGGVPRDLRGGLVAEAGEGERRATRRCGAERAGVGRRRLVLHGVEVVRARAQAVEPGVVDVHGAPGRAVDVGAGVGGDGAAVPALERAEHDPGFAHDAVGEPRRHHLAGRVASERQVQALDRGVPPVPGLGACPRWPAGSVAASAVGAPSRGAPARPAPAAPSRPRACRRDRPALESSREVMSRTVGRRGTGGARAGERHVTVVGRPCAGLHRRVATTAHAGQASGQEPKSPCRPDPAAKRCAPDDAFGPQRAPGRAGTRWPRASISVRPNDVVDRARGPSARRPAGTRRAARASSSAAARAPPGGTTRLAKPAARASSASTARPVRIQSRARPEADDAGQPYRPAVDERDAPAAAEHARRRRRTSMTRRSHHAASSMPPATAWPLDRGDDGLGQGQAGRPHRPVGGHVGVEVVRHRLEVRSGAERAVRPARAPRRQRTGRRRSARKASASASAVGPSTALRAAGRSMITVQTASVDLDPHRHARHANPGRLRQRRRQRAPAPVPQSGRRLGNWSHASRCTTRWSLPGDPPVDPKSGHGGGDGRRRRPRRAQGPQRGRGPRGRGAPPRAPGNYVVEVDRGRVPGRRPRPFVPGAGAAGAHLGARRRPAPSWPRP